MARCLIKLSINPVERLILFAKIITTIALDYALIYCWSILAVISDSHLAELKPQLAQKYYTIFLYLKDGFLYLSLIPILLVIIDDLVNCLKDALNIFGGGINNDK